MTPKQCKMARAALNWGVRDLAEKAGVNKATVSNFETGKGVTVNTLKNLQQALESSGLITFCGQRGVCTLE